VTTLTADARANLAGIMANELPEMVVAVVIDGKSGSGLRVNEAQETVFDGDKGEVGATTATVRVSAATFARPAKGATILVGGAPAIVQRVDGSGALWVIQYRRVRQVEGA
jgi:hypothetical protein